MKRITSRDNEQFRRIWRLSHVARERQATRCTILDGIHLLEAYTQAYGLQRAEIVLSESALDSVEIRSFLAANAHQQPVVFADSLFGQISPVASPTGVVAVIPLPEPVPRRSGVADGFVVFIDGVQDPGNVGSILRSAAAAGGTEVWLGAGSADPWSPKCLRGGMGAQFRLAVHDRVDLADQAGRFRGKLVAADVGAEQPLFGADLSGAVGFIVGAEGAGVQPPLLARAAARVRIPMAAGIESLNVSAAAAVLFYEWRRQRDGTR